MYWIFWCSCDKFRTSLVISLGHHIIQTSYADLTKDECFHITAARCIVEKIDTVNEVSPTIDFAGKIITHM